MPQLTPAAPTPGPSPVRAGDRQRLVRGLSRPAAGPAGDPLVTFGGDAAFGRGQARPWPARLAERLGRPVLNLAVEGAGPTFVLDDPGLLSRAAGTGPVLVEAAGLWSVSNPWYRVGRRHPRRVRSVSPALKALFPDLPLEAVSDLGRLLRLMAWRDPARLAVVAADVRAAWRDATADLLRALGPRAILLAPARAPDRPPAAAGLPTDAPAIATATDAGAAPLRATSPAPVSLAAPSRVCGALDPAPGSAAARLAGGSVAASAIEPGALSAATPADPALAAEAAEVAGAPFALARRMPDETPADAAARAAVHAIRHLSRARAPASASTRPEATAAAPLPRAAAFPPPSSLARVAAAPR